MIPVHRVMPDALALVFQKAPLTPEKIASVNSNMIMDDAGLENLKGQMAQMTMLRRMPALAQVAEVAAFLASDRAGAVL